MSRRRLALMVEGSEGARPVVASMHTDALVSDLCAALGRPSMPLSKFGQTLDPDARLIEAGVRSGDTVHLGPCGNVDLRQLGPELRIVGGVGAGLRLRVDDGWFVVGRAPDADVVLDGDRVSRHHAELRWNDDSFSVRDLDSRNGVWVHGEMINAHEAIGVAPGTPVRVGDVVLTMIGATEPTASPVRSNTHHAIGASAAERILRRSLLPFVVPSAGAIALAATASGAPVPLALAAAPAAVALGWAADRGMNARAQRKTLGARRALQAREADDVRAAAREFEMHERLRLPDPAALSAAVERRSTAVWDTSADDLELRIGLAAEVEAITVECDPSDAGHLGSAATAHLVPRGVRVAEGPVILAGPEPFLGDVASWMVTQAASRVAPGDLDIVVVSDRPAHWAWTAWLPHAARPCVVPLGAGPASLPVRRADRRLLVVDGDPAPRLGAPIGDFVIWRSERPDADLPSASAVITAASPMHLNVRYADARLEQLLADVGGSGEARLATALLLAAAPVPNRGTEPEDRVFLDRLLPGIDRSDQLVRRWNAPPDELEATIGVSLEDRNNVVGVRLAGQNSHVLIAGTTGSGKTRLLETLLLGLAATHGPDALNLFVIDFKGGNELVGLARLPHCVGFVSDRQPDDVDRAVAALTREVARRDECFASVGATDFADYRRKGSASLPRLVVVADEFGQFRRDDARGSRVAALLRIAAQGRSKGVHLVLATQTPSTDVTTDIRQNVGVRMCLRVAEASESVAVLGVADAVALPRQPGRVLVATDEALVAAQVALSRGARPRQPERSSVRDLLDLATGLDDPTDANSSELFDLIVSAMTDAAALYGQRATPLLSPPLPECVERSELAGARQPWTVNGLVVGQRDRPGRAAAPPFAVDLSLGGPLTIVGGSLSGRTTALLAIAEAAHDQADVGHQLVVYGIDWSRAEGSGLTETLVSGGLVRRGDFDHLRRLLVWLRGVGVPGVQRLVLVDRFDALWRDVRELDAGALANDVVDALMTGAGRGLFTVTTTDVAGLVAGPLASVGGSRLLLRVDDATLANAAGLPERQTRGPGRAFALPDGDEIQIGVPRDPHGPSAVVAAGYVGPMPTEVAVTTLPAAASERVVLGIGGESGLSPLVVELDRLGSPVAVIIGRAGSGRTAALDTIAATYRGSRRVMRLAPSRVAAWDPTAAPSLVLVDDAARLSATYPWLAGSDLADQLAGAGHVLIAAFDQAELHSLGFGHWLMRRPCPGLLLALDSTPDRIVAGERVGFHPPAELRAGPAGRGWWCERRGAIPVQVAH